jgi:processive 1,2-diacylglycerol beta-glucosyltransferase
MDEKMFKYTRQIAVALLVIIGSIIGIAILRTYMPMAKKWVKPEPTERKKILLFTSSGGRGHISAAEAIQEYLGDRYEVKTVFVLREVLHEIDFVYNITGGTYYSEEMYNYFLARKQVGLVKTMVYAGYVFMSLQRRNIERLIERYIESEDPTMIISVMPTIDGATQTIAQKRKIPFWVIPTDFDASEFLFQLHKPTSNLFFINCPLRDEMVEKTFKPARIRASQFTYIGMPVREQFLKSYDIAAVKQKYNVPADKPIIMVMMGGRGAKAMKKLATQLIELETPAHLLLCIGKQADVKAAIEQMELTPDITISIIEFTPDIAELMAISDLFVTKSGGQSVSEALYMGLPMLVDATDQALDWEQLNRKLVEKRGFGKMVKRLSKLVPMVQEILDNPAQLAEWKTNIKALQLPNPREGVRNQVMKLIGA